MRLEPVAETRTQHRRRGAHAASLQHEVLAVEKRLGIAGIEIERAEAGKRREQGGCPLPAVAAHAGDRKWPCVIEFRGVDTGRVEAKQWLGKVFKRRVALRAKRG